MELRFNKKSRSDAVRSVLVDLKARVLAATSRFDVVFRKMDFLKDGFGFRLDITPRGEPDGETMQEFSEVHHYVYDTLSYLFGEGGVSVSSSVEGCAAALEIVSKY